METDTRAKLIDVATRLFALKGLTGVSVREVTVAAQSNVSAISYYFNGKEGLYQAVMEEQLAPILHMIRLLQENQALPPTERLRVYARQIVHIHEQRPLLFRLMNNEVINPTECGQAIIEKYFLQLYQFLEAAIEEGIHCGDFHPNLNVTYTVISLVGILNFYFIVKPLVHKLTHLNEQSNADYASHAFQIYLHGILNQTKPKN